MMRDARFVRQDLLMCRCQDRQPEALRELVGVWERPLLYYIRRLVDHESDAWDVLQKTWIQVLRTIGRLRDSAASFTSLSDFRSVRNFSC
jgi:DNA-directed RNA polymerase specialized sigma24 family protein